MLYTRIQKHTRNASLLLPPPSMSFVSSPLPSRAAFACILTSIVLCVERRRTREKRHRVCECTQHSTAQSTRYARDVCVSGTAAHSIRRIMYEVKYNGYGVSIERTMYRTNESIVNVHIEKTPMYIRSSNSWNSDCVSHFGRHSLRSSYACR